MEFIDGEDLASLLKRIGYLPNEKALDIARQLVAGLSAAHERGVLHRDLKPANIMIDEVGAIKRRSGIPTRMRTRGRPGRARFRNGRMYRFESKPPPIEVNP